MLILRRERLFLMVCLGCWNNAHIEQEEIETTDVNDELDERLMGMTNEPIDSNEAENSHGTSCLTELPLDEIIGKRSNPSIIGSEITVRPSRDRIESKFNGKSRESKCISFEFFPSAVHDHYVMLGDTNGSAVILLVLVERRKETAQGSSLSFE